MNRDTRSSGFSLLEAMLGFIVLSVGLLAYYSTITRALVLSETNKQVKTALADAQSVVEEIAGMPFDTIMDPDYPTPENPAPRYRHLQEIDPARLWGVDPVTLLPNPPHLEDERVTVTYASQDVSDLDGDGDRSEVLRDSADVDGDGDTQEWLPLPIVPGSEANINLAPAPGTPIEKFRTAANSPSLDEFRTPEPLYITVSVTWIGPVKINDAAGNPVRMVQKLTFVRSR